MKAGIIEKGKLLFVDALTEGRKDGYKLAAKEFEPVYNRLENEYNNTIIFIETQKENYANEAVSLIEKLQELEMQKKELEKAVANRTEEVAKRFNILPINIKKSMSAGSLFLDISTTFVIIGIVYKVKERKYIKGRNEGYLEAKFIFEEKIQKLKNLLHNAVEINDEKIKALVAKIADILDAIAEEEKKVAELKIILKNK